MTKSNPVISLEDYKEESITSRQADNNDILSSSRIKPRRSSVAPTEIPTEQLPRYLRDPNRYANGSSRRQSLPIVSLTNKLGTANYSRKIPLKLKQKLDQIDNSSDEPSSEQDREEINLGQQQRASPLDNRLPYCDRNNVEDRSSGRLSGFQTRSKPNIPQICEENSEKQSNNDFKNCAGSTPLVKSQNYGIKKTTLSIGSYEKPRRHSIAVSAFTDPHRIGMDNFSGKYSTPPYRSKDRVITVEPRERRTSLNPGHKAGTFIPKPDNYLFLSLFSFLCCCPLLGLVALVYSIQVDVNYENGKKEVSVFKSKNARCWALMAVMIGMLTILGASVYAVIVLAILA